MLIFFRGEDIPPEEMDQSLFVPQFPSSRNAAKRPLPMSSETDDETTVPGDLNQWGHHNCIISDALLMRTMIRTKSSRAKCVRNTKPKKRRNVKELKAQEDMAKEAGMEEFLEYEYVILEAGPWETSKNKLLI